MTMNERPVLLVPVDFSEISQKALDLAKELAAKLQAEIVLIHVFETPIVLYPEISPALIDSIYTESFPAAQRALADLAARSGGLRTMFREGIPGSEIVRAEEELSPKLIVIGTHGRRGIRRFVLGSVAEYVVRHATAPVVTVRGAAEK
jgi:nucleotide-binding universal stress UspA family protein